MPAAPVAERLLAARSEVSRACDLLVASTPEALHGCEEALQQAVSELADCRSQWGKGLPEAGMQPVARGLRADVLRARRLIESLATFHRGWERILATLSGGYTANGDPAPLVRPGRLDCRG